MITVTNSETFSHVYVYDLPNSGACAPPLDRDGESAPFYSPAACPQGYGPSSLVTIDPTTYGGWITADGTMKSTEAYCCPRYV